MRLLTWNVQGLGGPLFRRYRGRLRQDLHRDFTGGSIDILLIQEHRLNVERISEYGTFLPGNWEMFWFEAYGPYASKGGVCISVAEHWKSLILHKEVLVQGRAQCVLLQLEGFNWRVRYGVYLIFMLLIKPLIERNSGQIFIIKFHKLSTGVRR